MNDSKSTHKVVLITGCSSGFGYLTSLKFARNGWHVFSGVREFNEGALKLKTMADQEKLPLQVIKLDVTKDAEVKLAVSDILKTTRHIDVLINNAGFGFIGPVEDFQLSEVQTLYDTNIFGALRLSQAVLPSMRQRHSGRIINVGSVNGLLAFGLYGIYCSSKFALEALSESLRFEVKPFGVDVVIVEPGAFLTNFSPHKQRAQKHLLASSVYQKLHDPLANEASPGSKLQQSPLVQKYIDPEIVATKLFEIANLQHTKIRYKIGLDAHVYTFIRKIVPDWLWELGLHKAYRW